MKEKTNYSFGSTPRVCGVNFAIYLLFYILTPIHPRVCGEI